jgi:RND superfamily putative drug exporter
LGAYVTGPAPLTTDTLEAGDKSMIKMMITTMVVITLMLLLVYRSISTVLLMLAIVGSRWEPHAVWSSCSGTST